MGRLAPRGGRGTRRTSPETRRFASSSHEGDDRNRTGVNGFAGRCVATPPRRHEGAPSVADPALSRAVACGRRAVDTLIAWSFPGRLAQLGERRLDKAEVTGSSPVSPIAQRPVFTRRCAFWGPLKVPIRFQFLQRAVANEARARRRSSCSQAPSQASPPCWPLPGLFAARLRIARPRNLLRTYQQGS